jgi:hypothetical protein
MSRRIEQERPIRQWDPAFREVFAQARWIKLEIRDIEGGVEVLETSQVPAAVAAIRAHAKRVDTFVKDGHAAARPPWAGRGRRGPARD